MFKTVSYAGLAAAALSLSACGESGNNGTRETIRVVGSSTVYPFATNVAENFVRANSAFQSPIIESTGTGGGIALFCGGLGASTPDIANASRRIKTSELENCIANGVTDVTEIQVGLDGIALASAKGGISMNLTPALVYRALAANPYGEAQTARNWSDLDPSLPNLPILVYGPPSTSGTRDAFEELILLAGCDANPAMKKLKDSDEDAHDRTCTEIRSDGAYVDQGEQDNLIVQKIESNPNVVGVFGYSYLEENTDKVQGLTMNGVEPTYENIANFTYPGARAMYIYVKKAHLDVIPGLREFVGAWADSWGQDGPLSQIGLVVNPDDAMARSNAATTDFPSLAVDDLN